MISVRTSLIVSLAVLIAFAGQPHSAVAADTVKLSLAATNDPVYLPFFVALDKGYYRALGLEVEPVYAGGSTATAGLISDSLQFSIIEGWRRHFNAIRPHESLGYKPPAPEVFVPAFAAWPAALRRPAPPATLSLAQRPTLN
jgi:hypothetical protein